jgi:hypothetical protein
MSKRIEPPEAVLTQKIVEAQGGAANREGGATFVFTLPPAHAPRSGASP